MNQYFNQYLTVTFLVKLIVAMILISILDTIFGHINLAIKFIMLVFYWWIIDSVFPPKSVE
jgi:hypothetical protein